MSEPKFIYEMVDTSSEEMYYPIAVFETLEDALAELPDAHEGVEANDDYIKVEIRQRQIGRYEWSGTGRVVASMEWERDYEGDGYGWKALRGEGDEQADRLECPRCHERVLGADATAISDHGHCGECHRAWQVGGLDERQAERHSGKDE